MTFAHPLGLLGLLAVPVVLIVHLYRRHLQERRVAGMFLWTSQRLVADAGRQRTRLLRTPSLWYELLAATGIGLWLAGPSFGGAAQRHVVFALDDSASMQSGGAADRARAEVQTRIAALASSDRVTVLRTGPRPEVLVGPRALPSEAADGLASWRPSRARHDPLPTLDLARELAAGNGEVVFCTDEGPVPGASDLCVLGFGKVAQNGAIQTAQRGLRAAGDGEELRLRLGAFGALASTQLTVRDGERILLQQNVEFADGLADVVLPLPAGAGAVHVRLAEDGLSLDNEAWLLPVPPRTVSVCNLLTEERQREFELPRVFAAMTGFVHEPSAARAQLVLSERPGQLASGQLEVLIAAAEGERDAWRGPFVLDRSNPWLAGLQLQGVVWLSSRRELPGQVLVAVGKQALLTEEFLDIGRRLWINLDPTAGNAVRAPDWPLLFANLLDSCRAEVPGPVAANVILGEEARYRRSLVAESGDGKVWLDAPDGSRREGHGNRTVGWTVDQPGMHTVRNEQGNELTRFAVRFHDPSESDLRGLRTFVELPQVVAGPLRTGALFDTTVEQRLLALLLIGALLCNWWWLGRRQA